MRAIASQDVIARIGECTECDAVHHARGATTGDVARAWRVPGGHELMIGRLIRRWWRDRCRMHRRVVSEMRAAVVVARNSAMAAVRADTASADTAISADAVDCVGSPIDRA